MTTESVCTGTGSWVSWVSQVSVTSCPSTHTARGDSGAQGVQPPLHPLIVTRSVWPSQHWERHEEKDGGSVQQLPSVWIWGFYVKDRLFKADFSSCLWY